MKRTIKTLLVTILIFNLFGCSKAQEPYVEPEQIQESAKPAPTFHYKDSIAEWEIFLLALIEVESGNNPNAIGKTNDGGVLQITPIYVREANRIQSDKVFTLEDRFDIQKSLEMFNVMNDRYNKDRDIEKAIKLHNPHAPASYRAKILKKMEEVEKRENVRKQCVQLILVEVENEDYIQ